jgi:hypothetical protein
MSPLTEVEALLTEVEAALTQVECVPHAPVSRPSETAMSSVDDVLAPRATDGRD